MIRRKGRGVDVEMKGSCRGLIYRVIHEERSVLWEVTVSVIVRKKSSYEYVCNYEWLPRLVLFESTNKNYCEWQQRKSLFTVNFTLIVIRCLRDIFVTQK